MLTMGLEFVLWYQLYRRVLDEGSQCNSISATAAALVLQQIRRSILRSVHRYSGS